MLIAGIGSRKTPPEVLAVMTSFAKSAASKGWWFRSGHADGADYAFETGAQHKCIVYSPWSGFNHKLKIMGLERVLGKLDDKAFKHVLKHEKYASDCSNGVKLLKCRNVYQILGESLDKPCDLVVCWTENGAGSGGTGLALKIAKDNNIPIIDLGAVSPALVSEDFIWSKIYEIIS